MQQLSKNLAAQLVCLVSTWDMPKMNLALVLIGGLLIFTALLLRFKKRLRLIILIGFETNVIRFAFITSGSCGTLATLRAPQPSRCVSNKVNEKAKS